jgi:methanogenic corrinoid protein MtbC1
MESSVETVRRFETALLSLNRVEAFRLLTPKEIEDTPLRRLEVIEKIVVPALEKIGRDWDEGRAALSQIYMSGKICEEIVDRLLPDSFGVRKDQPSMAVAVFEDYHLLGKRLVYATLRAAGFAVKDYGRRDLASLVQAVMKDEIKILLVSTLMLPSALRIGTLRKEFDRAGYKIKIVVGGAPFRLDDRLWKEVGADAMGRNASDVITILPDVMGDPR